MKKVLLVICAAIAAASPASAAPDFITSFFARDEHNLARTFAVPLLKRDTAVLQTVYQFMRTEDAEMLQPVFASNGFAMDIADLEGAIADARRMSTIEDIRKDTEARAEAERAQRADAARQAALAEATRQRMEREAEQYRQNQGRGFDNNTRSGAGDEPGGWTVHGGLGGGTGGLLSIGAMGRYGVPIAGGRFGNFGPELGLMYAGRNSNKDQDLGSQVVYTSPDGEYKVTDYQSRELKDRADLYSFVGASYQTPSITASSGRKIVNFEVGGRGGIGTADNRRIKKDGTKEEMVNYQTQCSTWYDSYGYSHTTCHDVPYWDTMSKTENQMTESGQKTTGVFYTAFAAANVAVTQSIALRLEVERYFLNSLKVEDATVGRVGVQFRF